MTTSSSLVDEFLAQIQGAPLQHIAQQLGTSPEETEQAVSTAVPMMMGALSQNAASPEGTANLLGALQRDHSGNGPDLGGLLGSLLGGVGRIGGGAAAAGGAAGLGGMLGSLGGLFGGAKEADSGNGAGSLGEMGSNILGHIFGGNQEQAEAGLAQSTGLGANSGQLLQLLAPLVMSFLAHRVGTGSVDAGSLSSALDPSNSRAAGNVFDQDGDGQVGMGDLFKLGASFLNRNR